ncbi:MAG: hypothetical protein RL211_2350 [Pseudomonadota bacterium]
MLKTIALIVVIALAVLLAYAATRPDSFRVERQATIKAPPDKIFAYLQDFHKWSEWSPWEKLDPAMKRTFSGTASGKGAVYAWEGNGKAGAGRMEILDAPQPVKLVIQLDFIKPFEGHNTAEFTLQAQGDMTQVTWVMHGPAPFISKLMGIFFNMDELIGNDFETGLAVLKSVAER